MKKQFEDFQKMKIKEACKAIEDMTFSFINPTTKEPTFVPAKHYENILNKTVEQFIDQNLQVEMLNNVYKQLKFLQVEYGKDFMRSLICLDLGIKPSDMSLQQSIALQATYNDIEQSKETNKKNYHYLSEDIVNKYQEALNDKELQRQYLSGENEYTQEKEERDEPDIFGDY